MHILAIDTSSSNTAVALVAGGRVLAEDDSAAEAKHGETLLPRIESLLDRAALTLAQIELIGVGVGPGSFTGLRVGLATAKGLAFATGLPIRGVSSLRALAWGALDGEATTGEQTVLTWLDAYRGEVFGAVYRASGGLAGTLLEQLAPFHAVPAEAVARVAELAQGAVVCGDGLARYPEALGAGVIANTRLAAEGCHRPRGRFVAHEALRRFQAEGASDLASLEPQYLRGSDAKLPRDPLST